MNGPLSFSCDISTEEARRLIDETIERSQAHILALKSQRNTFALTSRLPPEILCEIFSILRADDWEQISTPLHWIRLVTHVCHYWRNVAIDSPSLWVYPPIMYPAWVKEGLHRSKEANLIVNAYEYRSRPFVPGLMLALEHSHRIQSLSIQATIAQWDILQQVLPKSAPQLESLFLKSPGDYITSDRLRLAPISDDALCDTPKLRRLEMFNFEFNWDQSLSLPLCQLTHLKLCNVQPSPSVTWKRLMDILGEMRNLEMLYLENAFPVVTDEQMSHPPAGLLPLHLPASLQALNVYASTQEVEFFLSYVAALPPATQTEVKCWWDFIELNPDFSGVTRILAQLYSTSNVEFQTLILLKPEICETSEPGVILRLFTDILTEDEMTIHEFLPIRPHLEIFFSWWGLQPHLTGPAVSATVKNIFSHSGLPLQDVKCLYLSRPVYHLGPQTFASTIGKLSQVRSIITERSTGKILIEALQPGSHVEDANPSETLFFPNLSTMFFLREKFSKSDFGYDLSKYNISALPLHLLWDCLAHRSRSGSRLPRLIFRNCRKLLKADVELLEGVVNNIDWDDIEILSDGEDEDQSDEDESGDEESLEEVAT